MQLYPHHHINHINLLPLKLVNAFEKTLNVKDILFTLHQIIKQTFEYKSNIGFNLDAYLTLDKCRKLAQLKQDAFIKQVSDKINQYHSFINPKTDAPSNTSKPMITELARFTQLFYQRKSQLTYLQTIVQKISSSLQYNEKQLNKNSNTLYKMKNILQELQQKLIIVINKIQQRISVDENSHPKANNRQPAKLDSKHTRNRSSASRTKTVILKVENSNQTSDKQKVNNQQIQRLKQQYRRLNRKQQKHKVDQMQRKSQRQASVVKYCTEPNHVEGGIAKVNPKNEDLQIQQVINPTFQKQKITKHNTFFTKFVQSTKSNSILHLQSDQILKIYAYKRKKMQIKGEKKRISKLTKKPSAQSLFDNLSKSNPAHSFYIPTNLAHEQKRSKEFQNRASTAKLARHSMKMVQQKCRQSLKRFSRRQSRDFTIKKHLPQQAQTTEDIQGTDRINIFEQQLKPKTMQKITSSLQIKQEQYEQKEQDEMGQLKQFNHGKRNALRKKSRIKGISKTNIGSGDDTEGESAEKVFLAMRRSNLSEEIKDQQFQLQDQLNQVRNSLSPNNKLAKKRVTNENLNTLKLFYKNQRQFFQQFGSNDDAKGSQGRNITLSSKKYGKARKYLRGNENTVKLSQCKELYEQITQQWKQDKEELFGRGFQIMIRKKYDKNYKSQNIHDKKDGFEFGEVRSVRKKATDSKVIDSEVTVDSYRKQMWGHEDIKQTGLNHEMTRKLGQLGQKSMEDNKHKRDSNQGQQQKLETLYI